MAGMASAASLPVRIPESLRVKFSSHGNIAALTLEQWVQLQGEKSTAKRPQR